MATLRQRSAHSKDNEAKTDGNGQFIDRTSLTSQSNQPPPMYRAIRFFFKICLHSFYGNVEVEGTENIAPDNYPAILGMLRYFFVDTVMDELLPYVKKREKHGCKYG